MGKISQQKNNNRYSPVTTRRVQPHRRGKDIVTSSTVIANRREQKEDGWMNSIKSFATPLETIPTLSQANIEPDTWSVVSSSPTEPTTFHHEERDTQPIKDVEMLEGQAGIAEEAPERRFAHETWDSDGEEEKDEEQEYSRMPSPEWYSMGRVKTLDGSGPAILRRSIRSKTTRTLTSAPMNQGSAKGAPRTRKNTTGSKRGTKVIKKPTETEDRQVQDPLVLKQTSVLQPRPKRRRKVIPPSDRILRPRRV